ncbi:MAG: DNRLRE domain-containing protein [Prolixibacteraceae bacterium]|nr:DNRLRE domain-containing protein [Prolixibacteraceae bacterium]
MRKLFLAGAFMLLTLLLFAQKKMVLQPGPNDGKDATIYWIESIEGRNGDMMSKNYGSLTALPSEAWTVDGDFFIARSLLEFDFSSIPANAEIISAALSLYFDGTYEHQSLSGSNEMLIQRVTSPWEENAVTWNNQPSISVENQAKVPETLYNNQHLLDFDITTLVQDVINKYPNYGFLIRLETEDFYRRTRYASSDFSFSTSWPKLEITYNAPESDPCVEVRYDTVMVEIIDTVTLYETVYETIYDTIQVEIEVMDTVYQYVSVADTLIIDAWFTGINWMNALSVIKIYPNPTNKELHISIPEFEKMADYSLKISDQQGKSIFTTYIGQEEYQINFDEFANRGLYFVTIIDPQYKVADTRKILLK